MPVQNDSGSSRSVFVGLLAVIGSLGGLALLVWITVVMLDLKHLNTSGFTLPLGPSPCLDGFRPTAGQPPSDRTNINPGSGFSATKP